jgi:hypothetical protein
VSNVGIRQMAARQQFRYWAQQIAHNLKKTNKLKDM